jgi:hypothetical protein
MGLASSVVTTAARATKTLKASQSSQSQERQPPASNCSRWQTPIAHKKGPELFAWLDKHHWIWMNYDDEARPYAVFDLDKNDVFVGKPPARPGQRSQVAFGM